MRRAPAKPVRAMVHRVPGKARGPALVLGYRARANLGL